MTVKQEWLDCAVEAFGTRLCTVFSNFPVGACLVTADGKMCIKESTLKMPPLV